MHNDECRPGVQFMVWVDISLLLCQDSFLDPPSPLSGMYQRCLYVVMQLGHKTDLSGVSKRLKVYLHSPLHLHEGQHDLCLVNSY